MIVPPTPKTPQAPVEPLVVEKASVEPELPQTGEKQNVLLTVAGSLAAMLGLAGLGFKRRKNKIIEDEKKDELIVLLFELEEKHWKQ